MWLDVGDDLCSQRKTQLSMTPKGSQHTALENYARDATPGIYAPQRSQ